MFSTGLTSVTFRQLDADAVIGLATQAGLDGIEWGGDVHAQPGKAAEAEAMRRQTVDAGLSVLSHGSYYRGDRASGEFAPWLEIARALEAPVIRLWPGQQGSADASRAYRDEVASCLREATEEAARAGVEVGLEYHAKTLTDTVESALGLLDEVGDPRLKLYWQPRNGASREHNLGELKAVLPHLSHIHIFHWQLKEGGIDRRPLEEGREDWRAYLQEAAAAHGDRACIMEFVRENDPEQFLADAQIVKQLIQDVNG